MMAPATGFYATPGLGKQEVRLAYVLDQESLVRAMNCLATGLEAYNARG
jgi:aspartate aminotransferase